MALHASATAASASDRDLARAHSHNDYEQTHPRGDALDQGFTSVEADIWMEDGKIQVSHDRVWSLGTLEDLYLRPIQILVERGHGSVYGDGKPFILWLDLKEGSADLLNELAATLSRAALPPQAVQVILTGNGAKSRFVTATNGTLAVRDSNSFSPKDPASDGRWTWYTLRYGSLSRKQIPSLVKQIHAKGRKVRLWDVPEHDSVWQACLDAGVDLISVDSLARMHAFLEKQP